MAEYLIKGETLTGIADAIRSKTGGTEAILVSDMAAQIEGITGSGATEIAVNVLAETPLDGFERIESYGAYGVSVSADYTLTIGESYTVVWDGGAHNCVAQDASALMEGAIALGNAASLGLSGNDEPFTIGLLSGSVLYLALTDTEAGGSHTIRIYQAFSDVEDGAFMQKVDGGLVLAEESESGGGAAEGVHYVTFMSEDGQTELYRRVVADGDDCADPVARGLIEAPTKESTAQYDYAFVGWANTAGGAWDETALDAVTEDKTVYAVYASAVRYYTISYYDGDTLLKSESLRYGATPSYTPEKDGYGFDGWEPALATVTGDASYTAVWTEAITFANASWAQIVEIVEAGEAQDYFALKDEKTLNYTDANGTARSSVVRIVGFNHDDLADGSGKAGLSLLTKYAAFDLTIESGSYESGGWRDCTHRTKLNNMLSSFPDALQNAVKSVTKVSSVYVDGTDTTGQVTSEDKIWIPSCGEFGMGPVAGYGVAGGDGTKYTSLGVADHNALSSNTEIPVIFRSGAYTVAKRINGRLAGREIWNNVNTATAIRDSKIAFGFCI